MIAVACLFGTSLLGSLTGRAKDQVCRIQAIHVASVLKSGLFEKSLELSVDGRASFPPATTINIFSHDLAFFQNYLLKFHDIWSAVLQILVVAAFATWILGPSAIPGTVHGLPILSTLLLIPA
jgi:ABC-type phosphate/phosphonate transport system permease subunit